MLKLNDLKNLGLNYVSLKPMILNAGMKYITIMKRIERNSPELTEIEAAKLMKELNKTKGLLAKIN